MSPNPIDPLEDRLDRILRDDARVPLADGGFTTRVMRALPAPAQRDNPWLKPLLILGSTALGCALAATFAPTGANAFQGFADLAQSKGFTTAAITGIAMGAALLVTAIVLAAEAD